MIWPHYVTCPDCDGAGYFDRDGNPVELETPVQSVPCETCNGRGGILEGAE